jgi:hypothetical protein
MDYTAEDIARARAYITGTLRPGELLAQLAEEGAELSKAALKIRRALEGVNPTPMTLAEAVEAAREEVADVWLLVQLLELDTSREEIEDTMRRKLLRWEGRLKEKEERPC